MSLPAANEINIYNTLDEVSACEHFLNKSLSQAEELFRDNSAYYQEDLMWMGPSAYQFYLQAATNYLRSADAVDDCHMIDCLYEIVLFRKEQDGFALAIDRIKEMIDYVLDNYEKFNVDKEIYGDLDEKYRALRDQF